MGEAADAVRDSVAAKASEAMDKAGNVAANVYDKAAAVASDIHDSVRDGIVEEARAFQRSEGTDRPTPLAP